MRIMPYYNRLSGLDSCRTEGSVISSHYRLFEPVLIAVWRSLY